MAADLKEFMSQIKKLADDRPEAKEGLGQKTQFKEMKLELATHPGAAFDVDDNEAEIKIKTPTPLKTTFKLLFGKTEFDCNRCVFSQTKGDKVVFSITFPRKGFYKFNIFALPANEPGNSYPCVFTYMIEVKRATKDVCAYPKQYSPWPAKGCYLFSPLYLDPSKKMDDVKFKVYVPKAKRVAVKAGDEWTHLDKSKDEEDVWGAKVVLEHYRGKNVTVRLNAGWDDDSTSFESLLEYTI